MKRQQIKYIVILIMTACGYATKTFAQDFVSVAKFESFGTLTSEIIAAIDPEDDTFWVKIPTNDGGYELIIHEDGLSYFISKLEYAIAKAEEWSVVALSNGVDDYEKVIISDVRANGISVLKGSTATPQGLYTQYDSGKINFRIFKKLVTISLTFMFRNENGNFAFYYFNYDINGFKNLIQALNKDKIRSVLKGKSPSSNQDIDSLFK